MAQNRYYSSTAQKTALNGAITSGATSIAVNALTGYPVSLPWTGVIDRDTVNEEVVTVTGVSGLTLTVTRGSDNTSPVAHSNGASFEHGISARDFTEPQAHIAAISGVHGVTGAFVGTTDIQTLTGKTIALGSNTLSGTASDFNAACTDADFATTTGSQTLTNKTLNGMTADAASTIGGVSGTSLAADRTAWTSFAPTFTNVTGGTGDFYYKLIGKTLYIRGFFTAGTATATSQVGINLPAGLTTPAGSNGSVKQYLVGNSGTGATWVIFGNAQLLATVTTQTSGASLVGFAFQGVIEVA